MHHTTLSTKGQLVVPKDLRSAGAYAAGTTFSVVLTDEGLLFTPTHQHSARKTRSVAEVCGMGRQFYSGPALTDAQIKTRLQAAMAAQFGAAYANRSAPKRPASKRNAGG